MPGPQSRLVGAADASTRPNHTDRGGGCASSLHPEATCQRRGRSPGLPRGRDFAVVVVRAGDISAAAVPGTAPARRYLRGSSRATRVAGAWPSCKLAMLRVAPMVSILGSVMTWEQAAYCSCSQLPFRNGLVIGDDTSGCGRPRPRPDAWRGERPAAWSAAWPREISALGARVDGWTSTTVRRGVVNTRRHAPLGDLVELALPAIRWLQCAGGGDPILPQFGLVCGAAAASDACRLATGDPGKPSPPRRRET